MFDVVQTGKGFENQKNNGHTRSMLRYVMHGVAALA
jgi:hypothetical protein